MTIFAYIQNNTVINTVVAEQDWVNSRADKECYIELGQENLVQIGSKLIDGVFYPPQPYPSWTRESPTSPWCPPVEKPTEVQSMWNESDQTWTIISQPFPSWVLNSNLMWEPPNHPPDNVNRYFWDETTQTWLKVSEE